MTNDSERDMRLPAEFRSQPVTLRNLAKWWGCEPEELLDAVISVGVHGGPKHFEEYSSTMRSPNVRADVRRGPSGAETRYIRFEAHLTWHRLVRRTAGA